MLLGIAVAQNAREAEQIESSATPSPLLPVGLVDVPFEKSVKLYCGRCEDIYSPKSLPFQLHRRRTGPPVDTPEIARVGASDVKFLGWEQGPETTGMVGGDEGSAASVTPQDGQLLPARLRIQAERDS
ncbi:hypothetical protein B0H14DRAFT_3505990 [Mycena olivaceomarginata]|nr:hypothetical protein B0H14DRAFT_3505990 [Mycena olivaceomarginata]